MRMLLILMILGAVQSAPLEYENKTSADVVVGHDQESNGSVGRLAFSLAEKDAQEERRARETSQENRGGFMRFVENMATNPLVNQMWGFIKKIAGSALAEDSTQKTPISTEDRPKSIQLAAPTQHSPSSPPSTRRRLEPLQDERRLFEASLSHDDSPVHTPSHAVRRVDDHGKITDHAWSKTLFGERGVLTEIFHVIDEQHRSAEANRKGAAHAQSDPSPKINGNFDFMKIFDSLLKGPRNGEFGDPAPELPEFLGICNRLSCGDIYKAIDQFRRSEFFSNFQTALQLIQDPKGWEIIGKALENPELIGEFTKTTGLKEMLGSAIGESKGKEEVTERKKTEILPEDGDFGTDFTDMIDGLKPKNKPDAGAPDISFSTDGGGETAGGSDYYSQVSKNTDEDIDHVDVDVTVGKSLPPSTAIVKSGGEQLPELSFSVDETGENEETESVVIEKSIDVVPPKKESVTDVEKPTRIVGSRPPSIPTRPPTIATTTRRTTTTTELPTTTRRNFRKDNDYYAMYYDDDRA